MSCSIAFACRTETGELIGRQYRIGTVPWNRIRGAQATLVACKRSYDLLHFRAIRMLLYAVRARATVWRHSPARRELSALLWKTETLQVALKRGDMIER